MTSKKTLHDELGVHKIIYMIKILSPFLMACLVKGKALPTKSCGHRLDTEIQMRIYLFLIKPYIEKICVNYVT